MNLYYQVLRNAQLLAQGEIATPFQIGRQKEIEADLKPVCVSERPDGPRRLIITPVSVHLSIPRHAFTVSEAGCGFIVESSGSSKKEGEVPVAPDRLAHDRLGHDRVVPDCGRSLLVRHILAGEKITVKKDVGLVFDGGLLVRLSTSPVNPLADSDAGSITGETFQSLANLRSHLLESDLQRSLLDLPQDTQQEAVALIKKALRAFNEEPGTARFYATVAGSVKEMIDVDRVVVLMRGQDRWYEKATSESSGSTTEPGADMWADVAQRPATYSRSLVKRVLETRETEVVEQIVSPSLMVASMQGIQRAVASPIFDENRQIIAILYADKHAGGGSDRPITLLQASLLDVIANAVSAGLIRQRDAEFRTAAGQFFSKGVLDRLSSQKDLLEGRDTEVSILSCDIRGFSTIAHRAGPAETIKWINDVLTSLSECVLAEDGVVVDYVGDALMAMFGAPEVQPDHADRACRAACQMLRLVPVLGERYQELVEGKFGIGIGLNSGLARVGNTGSRVKFKYGPLGSTVNMASRIEGITKQIGVPGLMTGATKADLTGTVLTRRLTAVRVVGIPEPVQLYEIQPDDSPERRELGARYEAALEHFERQEMAEALAQLAEIVKKWPGDYPSQLLLKRTAACFSQTEPFDPVWTLTQK